MLVEFLKPYCKNPFRVFFPIGVFASVVGVWPWLFVGGMNYPRDLHMSFMMNGFLLAFVVGFLTTAIPRFTETSYISMCELLALSVAFMVSIGLRMGQYVFAEHIMNSIILGLLVLFAKKRFLKRQVNPPSVFIFVGFGLMLWMIALASYFFKYYDLNFLFSNTVLEYRLIYEGALLSLVIGVGGRLIPGILGWEKIILEQRKIYEQNKGYAHVIPSSLLIMMLLFASSFYFDRFYTVGSVMRACIVTYFSFRYWKIYIFPKDKHFVSWGIWLACWSLLIGHWFIAILPSWQVHLAHVNLISGLGLLTYMVASRVTLAHSTLGKRNEKTDKRLGLFITGVFLSMVLRVFAPHMNYFYALKFAALAWIVSVLIWLYFFIRTPFS